MTTETNGEYKEALQQRAIKPKAAQFVMDCKDMLGRTKIVVHARCGPDTPELDMTMSPFQLYTSDRVTAEKAIAAMYRGIAEEQMEREFYRLWNDGKIYVRELRKIVQLRTKDGAEPKVEHYHVPFYVKRGKDLVVNVGEGGVAFKFDLPVHVVDEVVKKVDKPRMSMKFLRDGRRRIYVHGFNIGQPDPDEEPHWLAPFDVLITVLELGFDKDKNPYVTQPIRHILLPRKCWVLFMKNELEPTEQLIRQFMKSRDFEIEVRDPYARYRAQQSPEPTGGGATIAERMEAKEAVTPPLAPSDQPVDGSAKE